MLVCFYSKTGNVRRFANKLSNRSFVCKDILEHPKVEENFVLITPTYGFGQIPEPVSLFLEDNFEHMVAVVSSGNKVWGNDLFGRSGERVSKMYNVPLLHKFQSQGFDSDLEIFIEGVLNLGKLD